MPIRAFATYESYDQFLPLIYLNWQPGTQFASLCFGDLQESWKPGVRDFICNKLGFDGGLLLEEGTPDDFGIQDGVDYGYITSLDVISFDDSTGNWEFASNEWGECTVDNDQRAIVVDCMSSGQNCLVEGDQCATDLDCCDQMYCSPVLGNCTDHVECTTYLFEQRIN